MTAQQQRMREGECPGSGCEESTVPSLVLEERTTHVGGQKPGDIFVALLLCLLSSHLDVVSL